MSVSVAQESERIVREWFANLRRSRYEHRIAVSETRDLGAERVLASGTLWLGEHSRGRALRAGGSQGDGA